MKNNDEEIFYICSECNKSVGEEDEVCPHCGAELSEIISDGGDGPEDISYSCLECNRSVGKDSKYCPHCGATLKEIIINEANIIKKNLRENIVLANKNKRILNLVIDAILLQFIYFFLMDQYFSLQYEIILYKFSWGIIFILAYFFYYFVSEALTGRTIGKFITGTKVLCKDGTPLTIRKAFVRTLIRFVPFDPFTFWNSSSEPIGWHDSIPGTIVVSVKVSRAHDSGIQTGNEVFLNASRKRKIIFSKLLFIIILIALAYEIINLNKSGYFKELSFTEYDFNKRGLEKANLGDFQRAINEYNKAIEKEPDDAILYYNRGCAEAELGNYAKAKGDLTIALNIDTTISDAYFTRGYVESELGELTSAIEDYNKCLTLDPGNSDAYLFRGIIRYGIMDYKGAGADADRAIEFSPRDPRAYDLRGTLKVNKKEYKSALVDFDIAIDLEPNFARAYHNKGRVKYLMSDFNGACELWRIAAKLGYAEAQDDITEFCK
ncbi:MAG: tetratricopeptide repeat protein [Ignavibacteria bacterium]|nr:tetratricopeptide repeat protein [Ignavibacteria bacterium]